MSKKMSINDLYTASRRLIDFGKKICKLPTKIYPPHYCTKCSIEAENGDIDELDQASKRKCLWSD